MLVHINIMFIWIGNPKPHLRPLKEHFSKIGHALLKKGPRLLIFANIWLIFSYWLLAIGY